MKNFKNFNELVKQLYEEQLHHVSIKYSDPMLFDRFEQYMYKGHNRALNRLSSNSAAFSEILIMWYNTELQLWGNMSDEQKYARFTPDEELHRIDILSGEVYASLIKFINEGSISEYEKKQNNKKIEEMKKGMLQVKEYNLAKAQNLLSEAMIDTNYILGNMNMSFRLANYFYYNPQLKHK